MSSPRIVVVGGGSGGGAQAAKLVAAQVPAAQVTLINPLPYAVARPTMPRMVVSDIDNLLDTSTALLPYDKLFKGGNGTFVQGVVEQIQPDEKGKGGSVVLADGQSIPYDFLVLAPGAHWEGPMHVPDDETAFRKAVHDSRSSFAQAERIVLIGGGAVAVEIAGELKDIYPKKEITIVHGDDALFNKSYTASFRKGMERGLHKRGVNIILNDYVDDIPAPGPATIKTRNGSIIEADLVIPTRGPRPRTEFIARSLGADTLDARGQIIVTPTLQLPNYERIFALGDAINWVEQKQIMKANAHAAIVAGNIASAVSSRALKSYKGSPEMIIVTNGKNGGRAYLGFLWGIVFGDWFARLVKSKGLLIPMSRGSLNL